MKVEQRHREKAEKILSKLFQPENHKDPTLMDYWLEVIAEALAEAEDGWVKIAQGETEVELQKRHSAKAGMVFALALNQYWNTSLEYPLAEAIRVVARALATTEAEAEESLQENSEHEQEPNYIL